MKRSKSRVLGEQPTDITFKSKLPYDISCDSGVELLLNARNNSDRELTVEAVVTAQLVRYTGVTLKKLGKTVLIKKVQPKQGMHVYIRRRALSRRT